MCVKLRRSFLPTMLAVMSVFSPLGCGGAGGTSKSSGSAEERNSVSASVYATKRALMSWVDEKASNEDTDKVLQAAAGAVERASGAGASDPKLAAALSKARTLLASARSAVKGKDKAAAIDAAASLTEVAYQIGDPVPPK
jgi:hypothetical protein